MNVEQWTKIINERKSELGELWSRMDTDRDLWRLKSYSMLKSDGKTKVDFVRNLTLPDPRIFCNKVIASLTGANTQVEIKGKDLNDNDGTKLEDFRTAYLGLAEKNLAYLGFIGGLKAVDAGHAALSGGIVRKSFPYMFKDKFYPGIVPWDRRFFIYEYGRDGLKYGAYEMKRSASAIKAEYPEVDDKLSGSSITVLDILDEEENIIIIDGKEYTKARKKHGFGKPPLVFEVNGGDAGMRDEDYLKEQGESILANVRDLAPEMNQLATVLNTITVRSFLGNLQIETANPAEYELTQNPFGENTVLYLKTGEILKPVPVNDIKQATRYLISMLEGRWQRGTLPATDYGNLNFTLSAVAIKTLQDARNSVLLYPLDTMVRAAISLFKLICEQLVILQGKIKTEEFDIPDKSLLSGKWNMEVELTDISPVENIANYSVAEEASKWMEREQVLAEVIHDPTPKETLRKLMVQESAQMSKLVNAYIHTKALRGEDLTDEDYMKCAMLLGIELGLPVSDNGEIDITNYQAQAQGQLGAGGGGNGKNLLDIYGPGRANPGEQSSYEESAEIAQTQNMGSLGNA